MRSVFVIDDHPVVAMGLRIALAGNPDLVLSGCAADPSAGLQTLASAPADCLVLDLIFAGRIVLDHLAEARALLPRAVVVAYSSLPKRTFAADALRAGADTFLGKEADLDELVRLLGKLPQSRRSGHDAPTPLPAPIATIDGTSLSHRELQIASAIRRGLSNDAIAATLLLSPRTIAAHRDNIRKKLGCRSSRELMARLLPLFDC